MTVYITSVITIICCALTIVFCRRYILRAFNSIDTVLDRILSKDTGIAGISQSKIYETTGEDRISKLTHKANRIIDMCVSEVTQTKEEKETIQGFISDMSHQMKTPLSGISIYADLLLEDNVSSDEQEEFLYRIKSGTDKLKWMMDSLIKMSRLEVGAIRLAPTSENIKQTISDAIGSVLAVAFKKNVNITVTNFEDTLLYHDRKWTREAIANVLENAVKYSESDGEIEVSVESLPLYTKIIITDHGVGVLKDDWNMIFKRFYRGRNVKDAEGAGLGLYLATLIMENGSGNTALLKEYYKSDFQGNICGVDKTAIIELNKSLSKPLDADAFERGEFALIATNKPELFDDVGNIEITCESGGKTFMIPFGGFVPEFYKWIGEFYAPTIFVSNAFLKQYVEKPLIASVDINVDEEYSIQAFAALQEIVGDDKGLLLISRIEERQVVQNAKTILYTLGSAVSVILGMIGILNFINVMSVGILARKRELATLESIGMSQKQVRKMLVYEGAGYAFITLFLVFTMGNALAIGICKLFEEMQQQANYSLFVFSYPFVPVMITGLAIIMICVITPGLIYRSISKASIVARLREAE